MANYSTFPTSPFSSPAFSLPAFSSPYSLQGATNNKKVTYTKMNPIYQSGSKSYDTYKGSDGNYYYKDGSKYVKADASMSKTIAANKKICFGTPSSSNKSTTYNQASNNTSSTPTTTTTTSSGGGGGGYSGSRGSGSNSNDNYEKLLNEYKSLIDELKNPKVWTADELAEHYGVKDLYNYDRILNMYNDATNKYYTDAIEAQRNINEDAELSNSAYANQMLKKYLNSYNNATPTAVGRGTLAANALSTLLGADIANEEASSNLNDIINSYKEKWDYEKANNATLARSKYDDIGTWLLTQGTNINTSQVQNYINALNAYDTAYSGIRNAQNNLASTAAAAYQQNANAALAQNALAASQADTDFRKRAYQMYYGNENNAWQKAYNQTKWDESTTNTQKSSAN